MTGTKSIQDYILKLGFKGEDKITGLKGVIDSVSFDLYGCIQYIIRPPMDKDGKLPGVFWFDANRIKIISKKRVMESSIVTALGAGKEVKDDLGAADKPVK